MTLLLPSGRSLLLALGSVLLGAAAGEVRAAGPQGTSYELEPMLAADANGDGQDELYRVADGPGDFLLQFNGTAESLPSYCCGLNTVPSVSESFTDNGNGTSTVAIDVVAGGGGDLFPSGLVTVPGNLPLADAALRIGFLNGSNPLDWSPAPVVAAATINLLAGGSSVSGGPISLDPAAFFGAPGAWSGHLGVVMPDRTGLGTDRIELRIVVRNPGGGGGPCIADATHLCLNGGRFRVSTTWATEQGTSGAGQAVVLTGDTGFFWFFNASNVEMVVKVLDGCGLNERFWVFAGGLTDVHVDFRVEDLVGGQEKTYTNLLGRPFEPIQDTSAFSGCAAGGGGRGADATAAAAGAVSDLLVAELASASSLAFERGAAAACTDSGSALCLADGRFRVSANWRTQSGETGAGRAVRLTADTAYFWFFNSANVELVVKVLNACSIGGNYWVFAAGLTNVEVDVIVEDTVSGGQRHYFNQLGTPYQPLQDTAAFACQSYLPENWEHYDGELPVLWVDPAIPQGGEPATVNVRSPGASAISLNASGDGCGGLENQTAGGAQLTQTDAVGEFGECLLTATVTTGGTTATHRVSFTVEPTSLLLPPLELVGGWFQAGDPPAATAGAPGILRVEAPEEVVSGGTAELRIQFADPAFAASVDTVYVKVPSSAGYNGYWEGPARSEGSAVLAELRLDPGFDGQRALEHFAWRRSKADDFGRLSEALRADSGVAVAVGAGTRVTAPATVTVSTTPVDSRLVQVSLTWQTATDVDLHVVEPPPGVEIYYGRERSPASGAELNVDSICAGGTENITWPGAALAGEHIVRVDYFRACEHQGSTPYTVTTRICGVETIIRPSVPFTGDGDRGGEGSGVEIARFTARCKFRVRGRADYEDRVPQAGALGPPVAKAIRFAKIFVYDENNVERGKGDTKQDGTFDLQFDLPNGTMYYVEVEARSDTMVLQRVADRGGAVYKVRTETLLDTATHPDLEGVMIKAPAGTPGMAFNIYDAGIAAAGVYRSVYKETLGSLEWVFTPGEAACPDALKSCMLGIGRVGIGEIPGDADGYDDWTILHEFGHSWVRDKSRVESSGNPNHGEGLRTEPKQAMDEGAATFFAAVALRSSRYVESNGLQWDIEGLDQYIPLGTHNGTLTGNVGEAIITATLWDLVDGPPDKADKPEYRFALLVFGGFGALRQAGAVDLGVPGPDFADLLEAIKAQLPAASKAAPAEIARCNHGYPVAGGSCP